MTSSYRNRAVPTTAKRDARVIADIKQQRKEEVTGLTAQAQGQIQEMKRQAGLAKSDDQYELKKLAHLSKTINNAVTVGSKYIAEEIWAPAIERGKQQYRSKEINPQWYEIQKQIDEAEGKNEELYIELQKKAEKLELETDKERFRELSHFERMGWSRAKLNEAAKGFGNWRIDQLETSEELIPGTDIMIKDHRELGTKGYEVASDYLYSKFYMENKGSFNEKYLTAKLIPELDKQETAQKTAYYEGIRQEKASDRIDFNEANLYESFGTGDVTKIHTSLDAFHAATPSAFATNGAKGNGYPAMRKAILDQVKAYAVENPHDAASVIAALKTWKIPGVTGDKNTLFTKHPDEWNEVAIENIFQQEAANAVTLNKKGDEAARKLLLERYRGLAHERAEAGAALPNGQFFTESEIAIAAQQLSQINGATEADASQLTYLMTRTQASDQVAWAQIKAAAGTDGQMSEAEWALLDEKLLISNAVEEQARKLGLIVDKPFLTGQESLAAVTKGKELLKTAVKNSDKTYDNPLKKFGDDPRSQEALNTLITKGIVLPEDDPLHSKGLVPLAQEYYTQNQERLKEGLGDPNYTESDALNDAATTLFNKFEQLQKDPTYSTHRLYNQNRSGFTNINLNEETKIAKRLNRRQSLTRELTDTIYSGGIESLKTQPPTLVESDWDLDPGSGGVPSLPFQLAAATDGTGGMDAWDYYNLWATKEGRPTVTKPQEATLLKERISGTTFWKMANNPGSKTVCSQLLKECKLSDVNNLKKVVKQGRDDLKLQQLLAYPGFYK
tara:strand:+ start:768 stop:3128 length:2361 start_codon:yes stop_codon:yes gene_type:complete